MAKDAIYRTLATLYGWTVEEIARMTAAQQLMFLETKGGPSEQVDTRTGRRFLEFADIGAAMRYMGN